MYVIVAESLNVLMQSYKWSELYYICMCLFWVYRWAMLSYGFVLGLPLDNVVVWVCFEFVSGLPLGNVVVWVCFGFIVGQCCRMGLF